MRKLLNHKLILLILLLVGLIRFINLGNFELQEWDESLYAVRAKSIVYFNDWVDQTPHSINGLYSSTHPPLYIWLTSFSYILFGINEFSSRLISAIAGIGIILITYLTGKELYNKEVGLLSGVLLGLNPLFSFWTRQGQLDILLTFFIILSFFFFIITKRANLPENKKYLFIILCGISIGLGLMTKLFITFLIIITIIIFEIFTEKKLGFKGIALILFFSIIIALPWHLFIQLRYGNGDIFFFFKQTEMIKRTFEGIEGNIKQLGIIYYINQMIIFCPYFFAFFIIGLYKELKEKKIIRLFILWFLIYLVIITIISTKLSVYIIPLLLPITLLSSKTIFDLSKSEINNKKIFFLFSFTNLMIIWSTDNIFRNKIKDLFSSDFVNSFMIILNNYYWLFLIFLIVEIILYYFYKNNLYNQLSKYLIGLIILSLLIVNLFDFLIFDKIKYNDGIKELVDLVKKDQPDQLVSIGNGVNPKLTFYFDGIDIGWKKNSNFIRLEPKNGKNEIKNILNSMDKNTLYVIIEKEEISLGYISNCDELIPSKFKKIFESPGYTLFDNK